MKRLPLALATMLIGAMTSFAQRGNPVVQYGGQSVDEMIADYMRDHKVPGMAVAIVQAPYITRVTGFGVSDPGKQLLSSSKTIFNIGQMADAYTAVALMQPRRARQNLARRHHWQACDGRPRNMGIKDRPPGAAKTNRAARYGSRRGTAAQGGRGRLREELSGICAGGAIRTAGTQADVFRQRTRQSACRKIKQPGSKHGKFLHAADVRINPTEPAAGHAGDKVVTAAPQGTDIYASAEDISVWISGWRETS